MLIPVLVLENMTISSALSSKSTGQKKYIGIRLSFWPTRDHQSTGEATETPCAQPSSTIHLVHVPVSDSLKLSPTSGIEISRFHGDSEMARHTSPWWWEARQSWWYKLQGEKHRIGAHPVGAPKPTKSGKKWNVPNEIMRHFHKMMAEAERGHPTIHAHQSICALLLKVFLETGSSPGRTEWRSF